MIKKSEISVTDMSSKKEKKRSEELFFY